MSKHSKVQIVKTAHYYSLGTISNEINEVWIVCHGYGQTAEEFIKSFEPIERSERLIIAPEGLSRFYWGGFTGPIASSWMTSKDRLNEIDDYCNWLDQLYDLILSQLSANTKVTLLGFSQGTATIMRWLHARQPAFHRLILWAGMTPEDISYEHIQADLKDKDCWFVYGTEDRFITADRISWQKDFAEEQGLPFQYLPFVGKHKIDAEPLMKFTDA